MRTKSYAQHERYVEICKKMELLGIKDVSTTRQTENGTRVWRLPIKYSTHPKFIEVASFATGYVRNQNGGYTNYQLNKRCESEPQYYELANGNYSRYTTRSCVLIPNEIDRLEYLIGYCLKNYYIKKANEVINGNYISKWEHEYKLERASKKTWQSKNVEKIGDLEDRIYELTSQVDVGEEYTINLKAQLHMEKDKINDLENKLATIERIARINASYR